MKFISNSLFITIITDSKASKINYVVFFKKKNDDFIV